MKVTIEYKLPESEQELKLALSSEKLAIFRENVYGILRSGKAQSELEGVPEVKRAILEVINQVESIDDCYVIDA